MNEGKTLYKVKEQAAISGVCVGLGEYLNMDISLVRILFVLVSLFTGVPIIIYIVFAFVLPEKSDVIDNHKDPKDDYSYDKDDYTI